MSFQSEIFILIGPPGSGKGSLSSLFVKELGWSQLSTGNLCRKHIAEQTEIGKKIDLVIKSGKLIDDSVVTQMVAGWFKEHINRVPAVILDGYPRTVIQAGALSDLLKSTYPDQKVTVVRFVISDDAVVKRLCSRYICENKDCQAVYSLVSGSSLAPKKTGICDVCSGQLVRRDDDVEESIRRRLHVYHKHEQVLIDFYHRVGQSIVEIDADRPIVDIFKYFADTYGTNIQ